METTTKELISRELGQRNVNSLAKGMSGLDDLCQTTLGPHPRKMTAGIIFYELELGCWHS